MRLKVTYRAILTMIASFVVASSLTLSSRANTLFGGVTHSEVVPAASTRYPAASLAAETPATAPNVQGPRVVWAPIPNWMAGKWTKQGDLTVSYTDLRTGATTSMNQWTQDVSTITWGNQIDAKGNIWQGYLIPWERDGVSSGKSVRFVIVDLKRESVATGQVVSRVHSIVTESLGSQIVNYFQQESLNDYFLLPTGELENRSSNRDFTSEGQPIREGMLVSRFSKVGPFVPVANLNGIDMLKSLNDYLKAHNMSQLARSGP